MVFKEKLSAIYDNYNTQLQKGFVTKSLLGGDKRLTFAESATQIVPYSSFQQLIRPLFGKSGFEQVCIGDHPDFAYLKGTNRTEYSPITTMFVDIANSTRLNLFYTPEEVQLIKNTFICATIELVKTFDGHVHRIMGDAIMAFFGGKKTSTEDGIIDSINCASMIRYFSEQVVTPKLDKLGFDDPFGIRIGVDYGKNVLWSSYGYPGINEVTATSFNVDVASKLQHSGLKNDIIIGEDLRSHLDLPDTFFKVKYKTSNGVSVAEPYLTPNYTDKNGNKLNYKKYVFDWKEYLKYTQVGIVDKDFFYTSTTALNINIDIFDMYTGGFLEKYMPSSKVLEKYKQIRFHVAIPYLPRLPYRVRFKVENHGYEAGLKENFDNHQTIKLVENQYQHNRGIYHYENTIYRGLHYMVIEVLPNGGSPMNKTYVGVYIK